MLCGGISTCSIMDGLIAAISTKTAGPGGGGGAPDACLACHGKWGIAVASLGRVSRLLIHLIIAAFTSKRAIINATYPHVSISALPTAQGISSSFSDLYWLQRRVRLLPSENIHVRPCAATILQSLSSSAST